jgi:hypothetical protein
MESVNSFYSDSSISQHGSNSAETLNLVQQKNWSKQDINNA